MLYDLCEPKLATIGAICGPVLLRWCMLRLECPNEHAAPRVLKKARFEGFFLTFDVLT
jgi:hypothetical protein